jgi:hypothetical protein
MGPRRHARSGVVAPYTKLTVDWQDLQDQQSTFGSRVQLVWYQAEKHSCFCFYVSVTVSFSKPPPQSYSCTYHTPF